MALLRETLEDFQAYILNGNNKIANKITEQGEADTSTRLQIYSHAYYLRLIEILAKDFPILRKIFGAKRFDQLARDYIDAYPSNHYSIDAISRHLYQFLTNNTGIDLAYAEIANLEWQLNQALYAADAPVLTLQALQAIAPEQWMDMTFSFHPSVHPLTCYTNAPELYNAAHNDQSLPTIKQIPQGQDLLVWRKQQTSFFYSLMPEESWIYQAMVQGKNFGDICEQLCEFMSEEEAANYAAQVLGKWINEAMLARIFHQ